MNDYAELRARVLARFEGSDYDPEGPLVFAWLVHHKQLVEVLDEPIVNRVDYILAHKPSREIETRLEWLRPVKSQLPEYIEAWKECYEAWKAYNEARKTYKEARKVYYKLRKVWCKARIVYKEASEAFDKAWKARGEAWKACNEEITAIHASECPGCPWDGTSLVFPIA